MCYQRDKPAPTATVSGARLDCVCGGGILCEPSPPPQNGISSSTFLSNTGLAGLRAKPPPLSPEGV